MTTFNGARMRQTRRKLGLTCDDLAAAIGVNKATISGWELGKYEPSITSLRAIAYALNLSADSLLNKEEYPLKTRG